MKLLLTSLFTVSALLACLALPACSGASGGVGGNDGGSSSSSGGGSGGGSGSGSGGGGNVMCTSAEPCGTAGVTYKTCTTTAPGNGACESISYRTSDGKSFDCDCSGASCSKSAQELSAYCLTAVPDAGGGTTTCSTPQPCGTTGSSYQQCTTVSAGGQCTGISYKLSNGTEFACASCGDCSNAVSSLDAVCQGTGNPVTTCTSPATCATSSLTYEECTTTVNGTCTSMYYQTSDLQTFQCAACGNCSAASTNMESYCASMSQMTTCGSATACGSTGVTYQSCSSTLGGTCQSAYYTTSDGQQFSCASCSDCSSAISSLDTYCSSLGGTTCGASTCSSGYLCCNCSGAQQCLSSNGGTYTCATYGCL